MCIRCVRVCVKEGQLLVVLTNDGDIHLNYRHNNNYHKPVEFFLCGWLAHRVVAKSKIRQNICIQINTRLYKMDISVGDCRCRRPATEHGFIICNIRINMRQHFVLRVY